MYEVDPDKNPVQAMANNVVKDFEKSRQNPNAAPITAAPPPQAPISSVSPISENPPGGQQQKTAQDFQSRFEQAMRENSSLAPSSIELGGKPLSSQNMQDWRSMADQPPGALPNPLEVQRGLQSQLDEMTRRNMIDRQRRPSVGVIGNPIDEQNASVAAEALAGRLKLEGRDAANFIQGQMNNFHARQAQQEGRDQAASLRREEIDQRASHDILQDSNARRGQDFQKNTQASQRDLDWQLAVLGKTDNPLDAQRKQAELKALEAQLPAVIARGNLEEKMQLLDYRARFDPDPNVRKQAQEQLKEYTKGTAQTQRQAPMKVQGPKTKDAMGNETGGGERVLRFDDEGNPYVFDPEEALAEYKAKNAKK